jgi:cobalt/nickel transport system permease protein
MLLVRSFDRSERIVEAMKCRGFRGRFYLLRHFTWESSDTVFSLAGVGVIAGLILMEVFS